MPHGETVVLQQIPLPAVNLRGNVGRLDPLEMNLAVAKDIPSLAGLDIGRYRAAADHWAAEVRKALPAAEAEFQKDLEQVFYTDPSDLFLNGVMDTRRGTCANMPTLYVVLAWRLGWPVSLACVWAHLIARYDDGQTTHNIEATNNGRGGFHSHPDGYYQQKYCVPKEAVVSGSDLTALSPKQMLGLFYGFRARHSADKGLLDSAREDYAQARKPGHWRKAKKRGRQRAFHKTTPPPPAKTIGGGGRISREIYRFFGFRAITWRRGVKSPRNTVLGCFAHHSAEGVA